MTSSPWEVARRPRWIAALVLALAIAAGFAALGQWQFARSVESATVVARATETVVPLETIAEPGGPITSAAAGQRVSVEGEFVTGDYLLLSERRNGGRAGFWVVGHLATAAGPSLAVGLGWAEDRESATSVLSELEGTDLSGGFTGRFLPSEAPQESDFESGKQSSMSVAALINLWADAPAQVYSGYLVSGDPPAGLEPIDSPVPDSEVTLNWLNLFYAAEWVVFAGFAVFLWYRLVRDAWEREREEADA